MYLLVPVTGLHTLYSPNSFAFFPPHVFSQQHVASLSSIGMATIKYIRHFYIAVLSFGTERYDVISVTYYSRFVAGVHSSSYQFYSPTVDNWTGISHESVKKEGSRRSSSMSTPQKYKITLEQLRMAAVRLSDWKSAARIFFGSCCTVHIWRLSFFLLVFIVNLEKI